MNNAVKKYTTKTDIMAQSETSGIQAIKVGDSLHINDREIQFLPCATESDMMVKLSIQCPFLSHKDYQVEVSDYLFTHFESVYTFSPHSGKSTQHAR